MGGMADVHALGDRARPVTLAGERTLPVLPPLEALVPGGGGLRRGSVVVVAGQGATSMAMAVLAGASRAGSWTVAVGVPTLGLAAAAELGLDLERLVLVAPPPANQWSTVVAALVDAFELVLTRPTTRVRPGDARRLEARVRERGGVLCHLPGPGSGLARDRAWPSAPDLCLTVTTTEWRGVEPGPVGAGRLRSRRVVVEVTGRREASRPRTAELWLPSPDGTVTLARPARATSTAAPPVEQAG